MTEKAKFINDIKEILSRRTFRDEKWGDVFAHDVWYVKDYLKGYFTAANTAERDTKGGRHAKPLL